MHRTIVTVVVTLVALSACGSTDAATELTVTSAPTTTTVATGVEGRTWILDPEASGVVLEGPGAVWLVFEDGELSMMNVCNSGGGNYTLDGDQLAVKELVQSLVGCDGSEGISNTVSQVLSEPSTVTVDGDTLHIDRAPEAGTLVFTELPPAPEITQESIAGEWQAAPLDGGEPAPPVITIDADGWYEVVYETIVDIDGPPVIHCALLTGQWKVEAGRIVGGAPGGSLLEEGEDRSQPSCTPVDSEEQALIGAVSHAFHLRTAETGFEVLDGRGQPVALLVPASP